jgi:hypothetical protein
METDFFFSSFDTLNGVINGFSSSLSVTVEASVGLGFVEPGTVAVMGFTGYGTDRMNLVSLICAMIYRLCPTRREGRIYRYGITYVLYEYSYRYVPVRMSSSESYRPLI